MRINVDTTTTPMWIPTRTSQTASESATPTPHYAPLYSSPVIALDRDTGIAVLQFRDPMTGHPTLQVPSETVVREYQQNADRLARQLLEPTGSDKTASQAGQSAPVQDKGADSTGQQSAGSGSSAPQAPVIVGTSAGSDSGSSGQNSGASTSAPASPPSSGTGQASISINA